jgi:hypothetical protein
VRARVDQPVCGELLISPESAIRHTQVQKGTNTSQRPPFTKLPRERPSTPGLRSAW